MKLFEAKIIKKLAEDSPSSANSVSTNQNTVGLGEFSLGNDTSNPLDATRGSGESFSHHNKYKKKIADLKKRQDPDNLYN
jgi:hypothetical protein